MSGPLKRLRIEHLRGSVTPFELPFEKGKKLTVIYGENGTGKSTICDAIEFLGNGTVGSLDGRGLGRTNPYWHSFGRSPADVKVVLESSQSTCRAAILGNNVVVTPQDARPRVEVLRRSQILALVEATPGDRYTAISRFIDVSGIEQCETGLRLLIRELKRGRDVAVARVQENEDTIRDFWEAADTTIDDPFKWARTELKRTTGDSASEVESLDALLEAYNRLRDHPRLAKDAETALARARSAAATATAAAERAAREAGDDAADIVQILTAARGFLAIHPSPAVCPLCESSEKSAGLADSIGRRLTTLTALQSAQARLTAALETVRTAERDAQAALRILRRDLAAFEKCRAAHAWPPELAMPASAAPSDPSVLATWLSANAKLPAAWRALRSALDDKIQVRATLRAALKTWREHTEEQKAIDRLLPRAERALEIIEEERRDLTDDILGAIASHVGKLYERVHPGEGLNTISLALDPRRRASLDMGASFCGETQPPQAYFSDSHLDTLGLCVFLALAARDNPQGTILVLDDVLASVDEPHVERLIEMLYAEAARFRHCVMTTHYQPWRTKWRWGWLKNGQCQFIELTKWSASTGVTLIRSIPDVDRLRALLAEPAPDAQLVCAKAGVLLEAALDFLTQLYQCHVPRRPDGLYTLGDLLQAIDKGLRATLRVEVLSDGKGSVASYTSHDLGALLDELHRIFQARNAFGCHFNALSFDLLDSDALPFGRHVLALMELLTDAEKGWPRCEKSGSYWATAGETRRLHPLKRPS